MLSKKDYPMLNRKARRTVLAPSRRARLFHLAHNLRKDLIEYGVKGLPMIKRGGKYLTGQYSFLRQVEKNLNIA